MSISQNGSYGYGFPYQYLYNSYNVDYGSYRMNMPTFCANPNTDTYQSKVSQVSANQKISTSDNAQKRGMSKGLKWTLGIAGATAIAVGADYLFCKGAHTKNIIKKLKPDANDIKVAKTDSKKAASEVAEAPKVKPEPTKTKQPEPKKAASETTEAPKVKPEETKTNATEPASPKKNPRGLDDGIRFASIDDAKAYFERIGIKLETTAGSERSLRDLNAIKDDLITMQRNGVEFSAPSSIVLTDWHKKSEIEAICRKLNVPESAIRNLSASTSSHSGYWGTVEYLSNGQNIVFINNSFGSNYGRFIHEMGHLHQDLETSFWHTRGYRGSKFRALQHKILGLPAPTQASLYTRPNYSGASLNDIFRNSCNNSMFNQTPQLRNKINALYPELNGNFESVFFVPVRNARGGFDKYYLNAKKMIDKMASESRVYAPNIAFENVAEIFQGLNKGVKYSDEVMLMYDFCGGGRVPNLIIKGKKYDDYIASLYNDPVMIQKLRSCIEIKKFG